MELVPVWEPVLVLVPVGGAEPLGLGVLDGEAPTEMEAEPAREEGAMAQTTQTL